MRKQLPASRVAIDRYGHEIQQLKTSTQLLKEARTVSQADVGQCTMRQHNPTNSCQNEQPDIYDQTNLPQARNTQRMDFLLQIQQAHQNEPRAHFGQINLQIENLKLQHQPVFHYPAPSPYVPQYLPTPPCVLPQAYGPPQIMYQPEYGPPQGMNQPVPQPVPTYAMAAPMAMLAPISW